VSAVDLARLQFASTSIYHFLFVPLTIGLALLVALLQTQWYRTDRPEYLRLTRFFGILLVINVAVGVVTGLVQEFQFGMNWSGYSRFVGDVFGAPLAMEGLAAFFLESTFLGLWLFGWNRLSRRVHLATIWMVALGGVLSAAFIMAANSWMQNPVGYTINPDTGRAQLTDIGAVLTNPQAWSTYLHVVSASFVVAGLFVVAVSAYKLLHRDRAPHTSEPGMFQKALRFGLVTTVVAGAVVIYSGDHQAKLTAEYEPMKLASAEALWESENAAGFSLFAVGDPAIGEPGTGHNIFDIQVPYVLSFLATGSPAGEVQGINDLQERYEAQYGPGDYAPNIPVIYWAFRLMMGLGLAGVAIGVLGLWVTRRGHLPEQRWMYRVAMVGLPAALVGNIFGWVLTEMGRQPWTVVGELLTAASVSPGVSLGEVAFSLSLFTAIYGALAVVEARLLWRYVKAGPGHVMPYPGEGEREPDAVPAFSY
jgi:cytochrome bd ubiquinol oxidase subunit I